MQSAQRDEVDLGQGRSRCSVEIGSVLGQSPSSGVRSGHFGELTQYLPFELACSRCAVAAQVNGCRVSQGSDIGQRVALDKKQVRIEVRR
jgi:hypothetical protein